MQEMGPWAGGVTLQGPISVTPTRDSESQTGGVGAAVQRASRGAGWLMVQHLGSPARPKRSAPGEAWTPSALAVYFFLEKKKKKPRVVCQLHGVAISTLSAYEIALNFHWCLPFLRMEEALFSGRFLHL